MSHPITIARKVYEQRLLDLRINFEMNERIKVLVHEDVFLDNVERRLKVKAFEDAATAVADALKCQELARIGRVMEAAGLHYVPTKWEERDGARWVQWATVDLRPIPHHNLG